MTEFTPGVHWFKLPVSMEGSSLSHINVYLIRGDNGYLMVDSGWNTDSSFATLHNYLVKNGLGFEDISQIFITHVHPDHYGMAGRIARLSGATIAMHPREQAFIEPRYVHMEELLHQTEVMLTANGMSRPEAVMLRDATVGLEKFVVAAQPERLLHEGEIITTGEFNFRAIWTPGHSSGHICLYEPERKILLSGDHILPHITPNISLHPLSIENPLGRYIISLEEIRLLDVALVLPGHNQPFDKLRPRIDAIISHHEKRSEEILAVLGNQARTSTEVTAEIRWGARPRWRDLPAFHRRLALFETLAHLDRLAAEGRLNRYARGGIIYYRQN